MEPDSGLDDGPFCFDGLRPSPERFGLLSIPAPFLGCCEENEAGLLFEYPYPDIFVFELEEKRCCSLFLPVPDPAGLLFLF